VGRTEQPKSKLMAALREKRARLGLVRVEVWVPRNAVAKLRAYAARLASSAGGGRDE
jgi:hypothetical protein